MLTLSSSIKMYSVVLSPNKCDINTKRHFSFWPTTAKYSPKN